MKLSEWAKKNNVCYQTAWNHFRSGKIKNAYKLETGTVVIPEEKIREEYIVCYARVSSTQNKDNLLKQSERLVSYSNAKGYKISEVIEEIGSGLNDSRYKLITLLEKRNPTKIVIEHKDRLTRFGFNYLEVLLNKLNCEIEIINPALNDKEDLVQDFISIITSYCAKIYGQRRSRRKTEKIIQELKSDD